MTAVRRIGFFALMFGAKLEPIRGSARKRYDASRRMGTDFTHKLDAAGPAAPTLVVYSREGTRSIELSAAEPHTIGRSADVSDIVVDERSLSRAHARFSIADDIVYVEDAGSTNGTFVRGHRITGRTPVADGTEIRLGDVMVIVRDPVSALWVSAGVDAHDAFVDRVGEELVRSKLLGHPTTLLYVRGEREEALDAIVERIRPGLRPVDRVGHYAREVCLLLLPETSTAAAGHLRGWLEERRFTVGAATAHGGSAEQLVELARTAIGRPEQEATKPAMGAPVFASPVMLDLVAQLRRVAVSHLSILLRGETGSGKDVLAGAVHAASGRTGPLRTINCGAIASTLLESTLFGHERGAFTGADRAMPGLFEQAHGGTVFLDEVGELSPAAQAALLRVLENHRVQRLGSDREIPVDVRVIAATHVDLLAASREGEFREDLFYRIEGFGVVVPPLRERREDIGPLADAFVHFANSRHGRSVTGIGDLARDVLRSYDFPGNVRELRNAIERAVVVCTHSTIELEDLPERMRNAATAVRPTVAPAHHDPVDLRERVRDYERELIARALAANDGNRNQTAAALGLPVRSLFYKLKELGITEK